MQGESKIPVNADPYRHRQSVGQRSPEKRGHCLYHEAICDLRTAMHGKNTLKIAALRAKADVMRLADDLKIFPGIVVGRFQRLTKKWNYFNGLKRKFQWTA